MEELLYMKDPQAVYDLGEALRRFSNQLDESIRKLKSKHSAFGNCFQGKPYDNLSEVILKVSADIQAPIDELKELADYAKKKADAVANIVGIVIRRS